MRSESGLSGRAARRASPGWAVSPHESPLISDAGRAARPSRARHDQYADLGADRGGTRGPPGETDPNQPEGTRNDPTTTRREPPAPLAAPAALPPRRAAGPGASSCPAQSPAPARGRRDA